MIVVVMGVSGTGKTTIGKALADALDVPFLDADNFHPLANVSKMAAGIPLTDEDRIPWLQILSQELKSYNSIVLGCSALKESYRKLLTAGINNLKWVYLKGSKELILNRMEKREGHFMKASMLDSQFEALEEPSYGVHVSIEQEPAEMIAEVLLKINDK